MAEDKTADAGDERLGLLGNMGGAAIDDQKNLFPGPDHGLLEKLDENSGVDPAFLLGYEPHLPAQGDGRDQAHAPDVPDTRPPQSKDFNHSVTFPSYFALQRGHS